MADIRIKDLPLATGPTAPTGTDAVAIDGLTTRKTTISALGDVAVPVASQAEAEAGVNAVKRMTPLTTKQSIEANAATSAQGDLADSALQPSDIGSGPGTVAAGDDPRINNSLQYVSGLISDWNGSSGTDNYAVLQAAINTGKSLFIPSGKYAYSGTLALYETIYNLV